MKTTFSSGVIVTSQWLNGAKQISFDGQDLDWHYPPLGLNSFITAGPNGLDSRYITLTTSQPNLEGGVKISGIEISGSKVVTGVWNFGYDQQLKSNTGIKLNPDNIKENAPKSYTTNDKYNYPATYPSPTVPQKFAGLADEDLITKFVLQDWVNYLFQSLVIDNGVYYSESVPTCKNYAVGPGNTEAVCPL
jgi:hypothetical protein